MTEDRIVDERLLPHPPTKVWEALTTPEALAAWFCENDFVPEVGRRFTLRMEANEYWDGIVRCRVLILEPPRRLRFSWSSANLPHTEVEFRLTPEGNGTRLTFEHRGFGDDPGEQMARSIMLGGTEWFYGRRLGAYLAGAPIPTDAPQPHSAEGAPQ